MNIPRHFTYECDIILYELNGQFGFALTSGFKIISPQSFTGMLL